ncbi:MAG: hypothetical protein FJX92_08990 [Bacteroidetes bacterium]|nr:hypothetical protein [Bacteroidota bacterium]
MATSMDGRRKAYRCKKFRHLQVAAGVFLRAHPQYRWLRYDLLSITRHRNGGIDFFFREDIYFSR